MQQAGLCGLSQGLSLPRSPACGISKPFRRATSKGQMLSCTGSTVGNTLVTGVLSPRDLSDTSTSGKIVRLGPNQYSLDDPEAAAVIYSYNNVFPKPEFFYSTFQPPGAQFANSFSERDNKRSVDWRRYFAPAHSAFATYESNVEDCAKLLNQKLKEFVDVGLPVNLRHWILCFAFDVVGVVTVRRHVSSVKLGPVQGLFPSIGIGSSDAPLVLQAVWFSRFRRGYRQHSRDPRSKTRLYQSRWDLSLSPPVYLQVGQLYCRHKWPSGSKHRLYREADS